MSEQISVSPELVEAIREFIELNGPNGAEKFAIKAEVSMALVRGVLCSKVPGRRRTQENIANAAGLAWEKAFLVGGTTNKAS